jgi:hypothetical protein
VQRTAGRRDARRKSLGHEEIEVKGCRLDCRVTEMQVHAAFGGFVPTTEDLYLKTSVAQDLPGGTVKIVLKRKSPTHSVEMTAQAVDFVALPRD